MVSRFTFKDLSFYFGILLNVTLIYPATSIVFLLYQFQISPSLWSFPAVAISGGITVFGIISFCLLLLVFLSMYQKKHKRKSAYYLIWVPFVLGVIVYFLFYKLFASALG